MMKSNFLLFIFLIPMLSLAQSPEKLIENGKYDEAIEKCVLKLSKDKGNKTSLYSSLKQAYETANMIDLQKVKGLKASGEPTIWFEVFMLYFHVENRYKLVYSIHDKLEADQVNIELVHFPDDLEVARTNAGAYLYAHAMSLLKTGQRADAMLAYADLLKITKLFNNYKDVELRMRQALGTAANKALIEVQNKSDATLPPDFLAYLEEVPLTVREKSYLDYKTKSAPGDSFSLLIDIEITTVKVSPGTVSEKEYTASHKAPEKLETAYEDEKKKAEDKKHPDYNKCEIKEIYQRKSAQMKGVLRYKDGISGKVMYAVPISAETHFENRTATASGDMFACPPEVYDILNKPKKKFPKNADMIYQVGAELQTLIKSIVWNEAFIKD